MTKSPKTGRELEPSYIDKGTPLARRLFRKVGIAPVHGSNADDRETEADE